MIVRIGFPGFLRAAAVMLAAGVVLVVGGLAIIPMGIVGGGSFVFAAGGNCPGTSAASPAASGPGSAGRAAANGASPAASGTSRPASPAASGTSGPATPAASGISGPASPAASGTSGPASPAASGTSGPASPASRHSGTGLAASPAGGAGASPGSSAAGRNPKLHGRAAGTAPGKHAVASASAAGSAGTISTIAQPAASTAGRNGIPASYLTLYQEVGRSYGVPWVILAGIGKVESDNGQSSLPGVRSGQNGFGAAGPMQIGIGGASGNTWGGAPVHPASEQVSGVAIDANGDGVASVYEPADAIAGAARYLLQNGVLTNVSGAVFAYNHLESYVQAVLYWAGVYASGGYVVTTAGAVAAPQCLTTTAVTTGGAAAGQTVSSAIGFAQQQLGKPYLWGGTGPDAFDCSGLVMMAYRAAGISVPRTSQQQWAWGPRIPASQAQPGDLVFFAGSDGTRASPGHVGIVIGHGLMIEAYANGYPIRIAPYTGRSAVGFTRPWAHAGVVLPGGGNGSQAGSGTPIPSITPTSTSLPSALPSALPTATDGSLPVTPPVSPGTLPPSSQHPSATATPAG